MFRIDKVKSLFDCSLCSKLLVGPVTIACGKTICKVHLDEQLENTAEKSNTYRCELCSKLHFVPEDGFAINELIQRTLDIELNTLKLSSSFNKCKENLEEATKLAGGIENITKDPENFIFEYFQKIKRNVDLRRERLKVETDEYSDKLINSIDALQSKCVNLSKDITQPNIDECKKDLNQLVEQFDTFEIDDHKIEDISEIAGILYEKLEIITIEYALSLLQKREYIFDYTNKPMADYFGRIFVHGIVRIFFTVKIF